MHRLSLLATSDIYWDEIVSIEQVEPRDEWVYDLSVAETHNFIAGNIIVHNSNIADAISWVIGEQRVKSLRGSKMEDVIFTGSRNRAPSGLAEVLLTIAVTETFEIRSDLGHPSSTEVNQAIAAKAEHEAALHETTDATNAHEDTTAPASSADTETSLTAPSAESENEAASSTETLSESGSKKPPHKRKVSSKEVSRIFHAGERITVGRRLYRTGESEYEMNGRGCRLRDIQDLFAGTGLGGAHYAIIEQGRIGQVLSAKPLDRRALIEEAAGISKFKLRQHQAELKLDAAKTNLSRVTDILLEVERQQSSLKRQAQKARRFQRLKQEMRDLMRAVFVVDYRTMRSASGELEARLEEIVAREAETAAQIAALEETQAQAAQQAREVEEALNAVRQEAAAVDLEVERAKQQQTYLTEQLQALGQRSQQFVRDQAAISERSDLITQEAARLRAQLHAVEQEINAESKALVETEDEQRALATRDAAAEQRLEEARKRLYETTTALERWRQLKRQFSEAVERAQTRLQGLARERERATTQAQTAEARHAELTLKFAETTHSQQRLSAELTAATTRLDEQRQERERKQAAVTALHRDLTAAEQRLRSLQELDERHTYFSEAVQLLLNQHHQHGFRTLGTLADFVQVAPEFEMTIEAGLRDELQYVVVPSYDDALRAIEFLKAEGGGRATFLVVGTDNEVETSAPATTNGHEAEGQRTLNSLLGLRSEYAEAFKLALPGLAAAKIVEDTAQAIELSRRTSNNGHGANVTISRAGERVVAGRLVTGGSGAQKGTGVLALKREIVELQERWRALAEQTALAEDELRAVTQLISELSAQRNQLDAELRQLENRLAVEREQLQQAERERERTATYIRVIETETAQAQAELADFEGKLDHAAAQTAEADRTHDEANEVVTTAQLEMAELRRNAEQRTQELSRRRAEFAAKTERRRGMQNDLRRLENETSDLTGRLDRSRLEAVEADEQANQLRAKLATLAEDGQQLLAEQAQRTAELTERNNVMSAAREQVETLDLQLRAARETAAQAREERAQSEINRAKLSSDLEHLANLCYNELGERLTEVIERLEQAAQPPAAEQADLIASAEATALVTAGFSENGEEEAELEPEFQPSFWLVPEDFDLAVAKARLDELRAKIEALGPVNMMALQELGEVAERFVFLSAQKTDIEQAIANTQSVIAEIKRRSRDRFQEAFGQINENFKQTFVELFGGGHGEMRLIDESDILESGIEIIAQPPGKRLQNVLLLSGGEKAMTAIALVLGIFKYRPSPFCLLDEVDAPLDEMNIGRFSEKIVQMGDRTQFMIITHSKRTMEVARTLYGVTMEDPGVSKLISVKLT